MPVIRNQLADFRSGGPRQYTQLRDVMMIKLTGSEVVNDVVSELDSLNLGADVLDNSPVIISKPKQTLSSVLDKFSGVVSNSNLVGRAKSDVSSMENKTQNVTASSVAVMQATDQLLKHLESINGVERATFASTLSDFGPYNLRKDPYKMKTLESKSSYNKPTLQDLLNKMNIPEAWKMETGDKAIVADFDTSFAKDLINPDRVLEKHHGPGVDSVFDGSGGHGCVTGDTMVYTSMCGGEEIEKLYNRVPEEETEYKGGYMKNVTSDVRTVSLDGSSTEEKQVSGVYRTKADEETKIEMSRGKELKLTPWHKVFIFDGEDVIEKRADNVEPGEFVILPGEESQMFEDDEYPEISYSYDDGLESQTIDEEMGYIIGLFIAEGGIAESNSVNPARITNENPSVAKKLIRCVESCGYNICEVKGDSITGEITGGLTQLLLEIGFSSGPKSETVRVPEVVWKSPPSVRKSCIAGMIDGDGSIDKDKARMRYTTRSEGLAEDLQTLLSSLGVYGGLTTQHDDRESHMIDGNEVNSVGTDYKIHVSGKSFQWLKDDVYEYMAHDERKTRMIFREPSFHEDRVPYSHDAVKELAARIGKGVKEIGAKPNRDTASAVTVGKIVDAVDSYNGFGDIPGVKEFAEFLDNHWFLEVQEAETRGLEDEKWYYDLTVPDTQNYMANGVIIHNSMTMGASAANSNYNNMPFDGVAKGSDVMFVRITGSKGQIRSDYISKGIDFIQSMKKKYDRPIVTNNSYGTPICSGRPKVNFCEDAISDQIRLAYSTEGATGVYAAGNESEYCFPGDTKITTTKGQRSIENICEGDHVLTHEGDIKEVDKTMCRRYKGDMVSIKPSYGEEITCTPEHPILTLGESNIFSDTDELEWKEAKDVTEFDSVVVPRANKDSRVPSTIDVPEYERSGQMEKYNEVMEIREQTEKGAKSISDITGYPVGTIQSWLYQDVKPASLTELPDQVDVDEQLSRLIGYYVAEGSCNKNQLMFTCHEDEQYMKNDIISLIHSVFTDDVNINTYESEGKTLQIKVGCTPLKELFESVCSSGSEDKKFPNWSLYAPQKVVESMLEGYYRGDGWSNNPSRFEASTQSEELANQIKLMCARLGAVMSISTQEGGDKSEIYGREVTRNNTRYNVYSSKGGESMDVLGDVTGVVATDGSNGEKRTNALIGDENIFVDVDSVESESYDGYVYNIDVEDDHSYVANCVSVHNCGHRPSGLTNAVTGHNSVAETITVGANRYDNRGMQFYTSHGRGDCAPIADPKPNLSNEIPMITYHGAKSGNGWVVKDMSMRAGFSAAGTSHATPMVTGMTALIQSRSMKKNGHPLSNEQLKNLMENNAKRPHATPVSATGALFSKQGFDARFGWGQVDIVSALKSI